MNRLPRLRPSVTPILSDAALDADRKRNADFLAPFLGGAKLESYAYPYGASSVRTKKFYAPHFSNLRGVHPGIIQGKVDLAQLNAVSLEMRSFSLEKLGQAIADARANNGWIHSIPTACRTCRPNMIHARDPDGSAGPRG